MGCNCENERERPNVASVVKTSIFSPTVAAKSIASAVSSGIKTVTSNEEQFVSPEAQSERLEICKRCEFYTTTLRKPRCKICGCFLNLKTMLRDQTCPYPEGTKWPTL